MIEVMDSGSGAFRAVARSKRGNDRGCRSVEGCSCRDSASSKRSGLDDVTVFLLAPRRCKVGVEGETGDEGRDVESAFVSRVSGGVLE